MRLLLILALLAASLGFGPPAGARADAGQGDAASAVAGHDHGRGEPRDHGERGEHGKGHATVHVCPGCAFLGAAAMPEDVVPPAGLPRPRANSPILPSFDANPIPPPPRPS